MNSLKVNADNNINFGFKLGSVFRKNSGNKRKVQLIKENEKTSCKAENLLKAGSLDKAFDLGVDIESVRKEYSYLSTKDLYGIYTTQKTMKYYPDMLSLLADKLLDENQIDKAKEVLSHIDDNYTGAINEDGTLAYSAKAILETKAIRKLIDENRIQEAKESFPRQNWFVDLYLKDTRNRNLENIISKDNLDKIRYENKELFDENNLNEADIIKMALFLSDKNTARLSKKAYDKFQVWLNAYMFGANIDDLIISDLVFSGKITQARTMFPEEKYQNKIDKIISDYMKYLS